MTILARPSDWTRSRSASAPTTPFAGGTSHYFAFLSYSHRDEAIAKWLHDSLEKFRVPGHLVGRITAHGAVPRRLTPIFRDLGELPASDDLGSEIRSALAASRFLIVLCSPASAASRWTNAEIEAFKRARPDGNVFAVIVAGEPFASDVPGREQEECLPRALRTRYDRRGRSTGKRAEPLAADLRDPGEARRMGFLKLVAGMLGVGLDDLVNRVTVRRHRRMALLTAASIAGMVVTSGLSVMAVQARDAARDQRREAEGLIGFMLGDLRAKLEPVGRLDALDGVGSQVLAYYQKQDMSDLSDDALLQRSRALTLMGEIARLRGNTEGALRLYNAALAGTKEALDRDPGDPQRLYDHAQNIFWIGEMARQRGDLGQAEAAYREYKRLAERMVAIEPDNMRWRMETQFADANLGIVLYGQRRFADAVRQFQRALATIQGLATADPSNGAYQTGLLESLAWLADAQGAAGAIGEAIALRQRQIALLERLVASTGGNVDFREELVPAQRALAHAHAAAGDSAMAARRLRAATALADELLRIEPGNSEWVLSAARARLDLGQYLLAQGQFAEARAELSSGCALVEGLLAKDSTSVRWRATRRDCLTRQAELALASGDARQAHGLAEQALAAARSIRSGDAIADAYAAARASRFAGDARARLGDNAGARSMWQAAVAQLPQGAAEKPSEMQERAQLLQRLGRTQEARLLTSRLDSIGYHLRS